MFSYLVFIVVLAVLTKANGSDYLNNSAAARVLLNILESNDYDPMIPPHDHHHGAVKVKVQLVVLSIDNVNEASMDYSLTVYLRQEWMDSRLRYKVPDGHSHSHDEEHDKDDDETKHLVNYTDSTLELDSRIIDKIWHPDTYFVNERVGHIHDITIPNRLVFIYSNGTVFYSMRISMTLTCHMELSKYPFDIQKCPLIIASYGYTDHILSYEWKHSNPVSFKADVELPTFEVKSWEVQNCSQGQFDVGSFSCIQAYVTLARSYGYYIAQVYVPTMLVVILSWVNFWLDIDAIPARISLGLLTVLTMTTMGVGAKSNLPRVSYLKSIDVWIATCLIFVFAALLEFSYVNVTSRVEKRRFTMREAARQVIDNKQSTNYGSQQETAPKGRQPPTAVILRQRARLVDKLSRIIFPLVFLSFNIFYWIFYTVT